MNFMKFPAEQEGNCEPNCRLTWHHQCQVSSRCWRCQKFAYNYMRRQMVHKPPVSECCSPDRVSDSMHVCRSVNVCGRKRWRLLPPQYTHLLYDRFGREMAPDFELDGCQAERFPNLAAARRHVIEVVQVRSTCLCRQPYIICRIEVRI